MKAYWSVLCMSVAVCVMLATPAAFSGDHSPHLRPFKGSTAGEATFPESDVCLDVTGAYWQTVSFVEGQLTHLGRTQISLAHCSTLDGSAAVNGEATFMAANGDELWATYAATTVAWPEPPLMLIVQESEFTIVGGTGRFENASGHLFGMVYVTYEGLDDPAWPLEIAFVGMIIY